MNNNLHNALTCEILAPAGSFECMKAAYQAGADAVYAGGAKFGARQTVNFDKDELPEAIYYSHIRGKKFYLTVNTLLKEEELEKQLFDYLLPAYQAGLDAVIVQDLGVLLFIKKYFQELSIHVSTQMNVTGPFFAEELKRLGVTRIVTARELSLKEISDIYQKTGLEIECFIHGALCYSYSGQCLLSSMIGARSGNRGRCAQPCRLSYDVIKENKSIILENEKYILSPKDLCTLKHIPDILEAGAYSLKIEGRMKKPEYVASTVAMYRKYVDLYLSGGRAGYQVEEEDIRLLKEIYNRGGFTDGYFHRHNGREMMSLYRPNHCGIKAMKLISFNKNTLILKALIPLKKGDVLEFDLKNGSCDNTSCNYTMGQDFAAGGQLSIKNKFQAGFTIREGMLNSYDVFRIRNNSLIDEITKQYLIPEKKCLMTGIAELEEGMISLILSAQGITVKACSHAVSKAVNRPISPEDIRAKLEKTGDTEFEFEKLDVICKDNLFIPVKELNELRRTAINTLRQKIIDAYKREFSDNEKQDIFHEEKQQTKHVKMEHMKKMAVSVLVSTREQLLCAVSSDIVQQIYIETALFSYSEMTKMVENAYNHDKKVFCALPYIFRKEAKEEFEKHISFYSSSCISGFVLRNMESYFYIRSIDKSFFNKDFIFDNFIYCYNKAAGSYLNSLQPMYINYSRELNCSELKGLIIENGELDIYGYIPSMITANCIKKSFNKCDKKTSVGVYNLKDRTKSILMSVNACRYCYNVIYYSLPYSLLGEFFEISALNPASLRLNFVFETEKEMKEILQILAYNMACGTSEYKEIEQFTRGHFRRGVQ